MTSKKQIEIYQHFQIPRNHWDCTISELPEGNHKEIIADWVLNFKSRITGPGLYMYGEYGVGKSGLGAILLKAAAAHQITGLWLNFKEINDMSIRREDFMFNSQLSMMERALEVDFLFVDEFQNRNNQHWPIGKLEDLVRLRHQDLKVTCISSNVSPLKVRDTGVCKGLYAVMQEAMTGLKVEGKQFRSQY